MPANRIVSVLLVAAFALLAGACGGGQKEIADVRACLEDAKLKVDAFNESDKKVSEGLFATSDLTKGEQDEFTFAVAAYVTSEDTVSQFRKDTEEFSKTLSVGEQKLEIDSGTDDRYVWVVGGAKDAPAYDDARACVQP